MAISPNWLIQQLTPRRGVSNKLDYTTVREDTGASSLTDAERDRIIIRQPAPEPTVKLKYIGSGDFWHGYYEKDFSRECIRVHWHHGKVLRIQKRFAEAHITESPEEWQIVPSRSDVSAPPRPQTPPTLPQIPPPPKPPKKQVRLY
jgi:hypothetical protein